MQNTDISKLVTEALLAMGCDPKLMSDLEAHADIVLDFHSLPSIHLTRDGDDIRLWAALGERHEHQLLIERHAVQLLQELTHERPYVRGGTLSMAIQDETLQLGAVLHPDYLSDSEKFSEALNDFFSSVGLCNQIVGV